MNRLANWLISLCCLLLGTTLFAEESVDVCFNYGCKAHAVANISLADLKKMARRFQYVNDAPTERLAIALTVGELARIAGEQTPIHADKGGNGGDESALEGKMDCYDHAATTSSYLQLMQRMGWLRFHRLHPYVERAPLLFNYHRSASIEEKSTQAIFVIDDWFFDNGEPAAVFPFAQWHQGATPDDIGNEGIYVQRHPVNAINTASSSVPLAPPLPATK